MNTRILPFCALALVCQMCAGMSFEMKRDIPYYLPDTYTNEHIETFCKLNLRYPTDATNFATVVWFLGGWLGTRPVHQQGCRGGFAVCGAREGVARVGALRALR